MFLKTQFPGNNNNNNNNNNNFFFFFLKQNTFIDSHSENTMDR